MTTPAIETIGLTKHYPGVAALSDLSLAVPAGSIYGFLGPNGSGKSTTLKLLAGLIRPTSGSASVFGVPLSAGAAYRSEVGYLAQDPRFYDWMTGREILKFVAALGARTTSEDAKIDDVLARVGLGDAADRATKTYSGGMRQRLGIAQALVTNPRVVLLDEPASALDPIGRREVLDLLGELRGEVTVFYSTHILDDVQRVSDHVAILDGGRLVRASATSELLASFTADRLVVVLGRATDQTAVDLASIPEVVSVEPDGRDGDARKYTVQIRPDSAADAQRAVMHLAADQDLLVIENAVSRLDLEDVFFRLIDPQEHAA
jgi:ABC-2 type transport system ATP-binding protein